MRTELVPQAVAVAGRVRDAERLGTFEHATREFVRLLGTVPDCAVHEISNAEVLALRTIADGVIDRIETRLASGIDPAVRQQALAGTVYEISRRLEEVTAWHRHYGMGRSS
jgi:hypothetical protein